jgi:hypothetical protein
MLRGSWNWLFAPRNALHAAFVSPPPKRDNSFSLRINDPTHEQQAAMQSAGSVLGVPPITGKD